MEVLIPTRNDYTHLERTIQILKSFENISTIHIIDSASEEQIAQILRMLCEKESKCSYHRCSLAGKGRAIRTGIEKTSEDLLCFDADIENFSREMVVPLINKLEEGCDLVKADFIRTNGQSDTSFVKRILKERFPDILIERATGGIYGVKRRVLERIVVPDSWSVDLSILLQAHLKGFLIGEVFIGELKDKRRSLKSLEDSRDCLVQELVKQVGASNHG